MSQDERQSSESDGPTSANLYLTVVTSPAETPPGEVISMENHQNLVGRFQLTRRHDTGRYWLLPKRAAAQTRRPPSITDPTIGHDFAPPGGASLASSPCCNVGPVPSVGTHCNCIACARHQHYSTGRAGSRHTQSRTPAPRCAKHAHLRARQRGLLLNYGKLSQTNSKIY